MVVSIVEVQSVPTSQVVPMATVPSAGDLVFYCVSSSRTPPRNVVGGSVTGLGATWAPLYNVTGDRASWWVGTGATTSGNISCTFDGGTPAAAAAAWIVRGLAATTVQQIDTVSSAAATALAGTSQNAELGQVALALGRSGGTLTFPSASTPSGWAGSGSGTAKAANRVPTTAPVAHRVDATSTVSDLMIISQLIVGPTAPPNPPTGLTVTDLGQTEIDAAWTAPATGAAPTSYQYRIDGGAAVSVGLAVTATVGGFAPGSPHTIEVRTVAASGTSAWTAPLAFTTTDPQPPAPGIASQAVLAAVGLDPDPNGADAPAQQWWSIDAADVATYSAVRSEALVSYAIGYASREPLGRPQPLSVGVVLLVPIGDAVAIGDRFQLRLSATLAEALDLGDDAAIRATCIVTDVQSDPSRTWTLPGHGAATLYNVTATGFLSRYGAELIDGTSWPTEPVGARIARILGSLGLSGDVDTTGADVLPPQVAGSHHQQLAPVLDSTTGRMVEQRDGTVDYNAPDDRRGTLPQLSLDASEILGDNFSWRQSVGDVVNDAEVTYGGGTGSKVHVRDPASADPRSGVGPYPSQISTVLEDELAAVALATDIVGRRAWPYYQLPAVAIDLARSGLDLARLAATFEIVSGHRVTLSTMPPGSPWETLPRGCFVEGYTETATAYAWRLSLVVSDPALSGVSLRYLDVTPGITYDDVTPGISYLDVARLEDPADLT